MRTLLASTALAIAALSSAAMPTLTPGMTAPKLDVAGWLKYDAPKAQKGHFEVVEFWATWCGPCKQSIPHLTEMAKKYAGKVDFVGVSVYEQPSTSVDDLKKFVAGFGDKMDYHVAYDKSDKTMAKSWMEAAGQRGIPASFLIDDKGTILWVGHPMELEKPLEEAVSGKFDVEKSKAEFVAAAKEQDEAEALQKSVTDAADAYKAGKKDEAEKAWNDAIAKSPRMASMVQQVRLSAYPAGSPESEALITKLVDGSAQDQMLAAMAGMRMVKTNATGARSIADRVSAKSQDCIVLYYAAVTYSQLDANAEAVKAAEASLAKYETDPRKDQLNGFKEAVTKVRDEAVAKSGKSSS